MKHKARNHSRVWPVVLAALIVSVIALGAVYAGDIAKAFRADHTQDTLKGMYKKSAVPSFIDWLMPTAQADEWEAPEEEMPVIQDDFLELYEQNEHLVGWLTAGGRIDYPVVQYDNSYYLDHDYFGSRDENGTLFLNEANYLDPRDSILLIHGHNMKSGAMFADLALYREYEYLCEHPIVTFRTIWDEEDVCYVPVAAFDASMNPAAKGYFNIARVRFDFEQAQEDVRPLSTELEEYLAQMRGSSYWESPAEADSADEYIMLITCSYFHDDGRLVLLCRRLRDGETGESIHALFNP